MRRLPTLLLLLSLALSGRTQVCTVFGADYADNFIDCANDPATVSIVFGPPPHPSGYGDVSIIGTEPAVDISGLTIVIPDKMRLIFSGNIIFDANTNFQGSGGNAEVQFGLEGPVWKANRGINSLLNLNALVILCAGNPNAMQCMELATFLPVELTEFRGRPENDMVALYWITASELNNDYFSVEHSADGVTFSTVGTVQGAGTTSQEVGYEFLHRHPSSGANYYRLKQVDYDGIFEYSDLIVVNMQRNTAEVEIFPNPTIDRTFIRIGKQPDRISFRLSNLLGQEIHRLPQRTDTGWQLDLSGLVDGIYILSMEYDGKTRTKRIVKE